MNSWETETPSRKKTGADLESRNHFLKNKNIMNWKQRIARCFRSFGYDLSRYQPNRHPLAQLTQLLKTYDVNLVLDIGANLGQYATELRSNGYAGKIVSFEPLDTAYTQLEKTASKDPLWDTHKYALGANLGTSVINIAGNSHSSSLLGMLPAHEEAAPSSKYIGTQEIIVETVDRLLPKIDYPNTSIWMKIDTQGFEGEVLKGSLDSLGRISTIQLEMSLVPLYDGSETFESLLQWMLDHHYGLVALQPGFTDNETGRLLQVDGIFHAR